MTLKDLINKILGLPTEGDLQKAKVQKALLEDIQNNVNDISSEYSETDRHRDDLQNSLDLMEMYASSTVFRTVGKLKDRDIFAVRIIKKVGQNYQRIGLSVIIDCEQDCIMDENGKIIMRWS